MEYDYAELLKRGRSQLPEVSSKHERLELPKPLCRIFGMRSIIFNFKEIAQALNRNPKHLLKFFTREMATAATTQGSRAVFQGKFSQETLRRLLQRYVDSFVICPICKLPDTKIVKEKRLQFLTCEACGAKSAVQQL